MARRILMVMVLGGIVSGLFGCAAITRNRDTVNPALLEPQTIAKFSDVPVPLGFKLIPQDSYSFEAAGVRMGLLKYHGKGNADLIVNFYREQMAMYNWSLLNVIEYGQRLMNFDRDAETCIVNIVPKASAVDIVIAIGPKSQAAVKKNKPVVK